MNEIEKSKVYRIAKHYGLKKQKIQAVQELNELSAVLLRRKDQIQNTGKRCLPVLHEIQKKIYTDQLDHGNHETDQIELDKFPKRL